MENQTSFARAEYAGKKRQTRRERFLADMEAVVPWARLVALITPFYPTGKRGRLQAIHSHRYTRAYGSPRMARELRATGSPRSVNRVARVMRAAGLRVRARSPYRPKTTQADHAAAAPSPNLLARAAAPPRSPAPIW